MDREGLEIAPQAHQRAHLKVETIRLKVPSRFYIPTDMPVTKPFARLNAGSCDPSGDAMPPQPSATRARRIDKVSVLVSWAFSSSISQPCYGRIAVVSGISNRESCRLGSADQQAKTLMT